jgi:tetratricopeptide (TPR) repeat protein
VVNETPDQPKPAAPSVKAAVSPPLSSAAKKPAPSKPAAPPKKEASPFKDAPVAESDWSPGEDSSFDSQPTQAHIPEPTPPSDRPFAGASMRDPARPSKPAPVSDDPLNEETAAPEDSEVSEEARPFGDATFLAIQRLGKKKNKSRKLLIGLAAAAAVAAGFFVLTQGPRDSQGPSVAEVPSQTPPETVATLVRPPEWYTDQGPVFQRFLSQMASMPQSELNLPQNRALIAEALVLNGSLSGNFDQVAQGVSFGSSLVLSYPQEVFGFYALAAAAFFKEDAQTMRDLVGRWPENHKKSFEYRLTQSFVETQSPDRSSASSLLKSLLSEYEDHSRAQVLALSFALDHWATAETDWGAEQLQSLVKKFTSQRSKLTQAGAPLPDFYRSVDRRLQRKLNAEKPAAVAQAAPTPTPPKKSEAKVEPKKAPPKPAPKAKQPTKLPSPSSTLVAANKKTERELSQAEKIYQEGLEQLKANKTSEAIVTFQKSLRLDPDLAESYRQLGEIYMKRNENDRALRSLKIYLQLKPDSSDKQVVEGWINSLQ